MRIAIVGPIKTAGGMSVHVRELSKGLRKKGGEVVIIPKLELGGISSGPYYLSHIFRDFDVVHIQGLQNFEPLIAAVTTRKLVGSRCVATAHGFGGESRWWRSSVQRNLMKSVLRQFDALISISQYVQNRLSRFSGLKPPKLMTVYNGVDTSFFNPKIDSTSFRQKIGVEGDFVILYVGRLAWNKGIPDLIDGVGIARTQIPNLRLFICGRGRMERELKDQVDRLGLNRVVSFEGLVPEDKLPFYYASSDIVASPSIFEPFGLVLLEALAMCKPLIATNVGGIPEVVKDMETGMLIPAHSPSSIARAILTLSSDAALRRKLGENGRRLVETNFTFEKMADSTWECYRSIM